MKDMLGKYVERVSVSDGECFLMFHNGSVTITYEAYGDCCSESWFADITGLDNLRGQTVIGVRILAGVVLSNIHKLLQVFNPEFYAVKLLLSTLK